MGSAGARLAALLAEAAAGKASGWAIPVPQQPHAALQLQRLEEVGRRVPGAAA
jgi:hypothetical protein